MRATNGPQEPFQNQVESKAMNESHLKKHVAWEQLLEQKPELHRIFHSIASVCPRLTRMELRVCVLVREGLKSFEIANALGMEEHSVGNHRTKAHRKFIETLQIDPTLRLDAYLRSLIL
jgi:DNA-binding NarL/FixJ family response regulator